MSRGKRILVALTFLSANFLSAQNLHLRQSVYFHNETIDGVAYFANERLLDHTYYVSVYSKDGTAISRDLVFATQANTPFKIAIPENTKSGYHTLQLANYHNRIVTHTANILILNETDWHEVKVAPSIERKLPTNAKSTIDFTFTNSSGSG